MSKRPDNPETLRPANRGVPSRSRNTMPGPEGPGPEDHDPEAGQCSGDPLTRLHDLELINKQLLQTLDELKQSQSHLAELYDFSPIGYLTLDRHGAIEEINLTGATLLGLPRNELLNQHFAHFVCREDAGRWQQVFRSLLTQGQSQVCELALQLDGKALLYTRLDCLGLTRDTQGPMVRITLTDISDHIRSDEALRTQEEFFRMIAEGADDFIAVLDLNGFRLYNNPAYARIFGNAESLKGTDSFADIHPDDRERIQHVFRETVQTGIGHRTEFRFVAADGRIRHMESCGALVKNQHGEALYVVVVSHEITARKLAENAIYDLAFHDALTKLPNRLLLNDRLTQAMASSKRSGLYCALLFIDLDNFKPLNDHCGHDVGDLLLIEVASRINLCVREVDTVARFGGDEFVIVLTELTADKSDSINQASVVAEKIRVALAQPYFLKLLKSNTAETTIEHRCTTSIGMVPFINHETSPEALLKRADMAMYQAKEAGRNQICLAVH